MSKELILNITAEGDIYRTEDNKHIAHVNKETGELKLSNPAYGKGNYKEAIAALVEKAKQTTVKEEQDIPELHAVTPDSGEREDSTNTDKSEPQPARCPSLGSFSDDWINWDHRNLSDENFSVKYKSSAACQLEFIARRPDLFTDIEALEVRLANLNS